jgi:DNA-binding MarR family transcriptional regulator
MTCVLEEFGPASQASLGRRTSMDRSDVVAALNDLARDGLVRRSPDPADHRRNVITITPAGAARLRRSTGCSPGFRTRCSRRCQPASAAS